MRSPKNRASPSMRTASKRPWLSRRKEQEQRVRKSLRKSLHRIPQNSMQKSSPRKTKMAKRSCSFLDRMAKRSSLQQTAPKSLSSSRTTRSMQKAADRLVIPAPSLAKRVPFRSKTRRSCQMVSSMSSVPFLKASSVKGKRSLSQLTASEERTLRETIRAHTCFRQHFAAYLAIR